MSCQVRLTLLPGARCMFDEPVQVKVSGLRARQVVTMRAKSTDDKGVVFSSRATYRADESGEIDLERDPSLSGTYVGVEPMGLLWSMRGNALHKRFLKTNSVNPHMVRFSVHEDEKEEEEEEGRILAEVTNERLLMAESVRRLPVEEGSFQGVLFTPPGRGPFPAVLDLCTYMSEKRASLLASRGFVVLTVPVYTDKTNHEIHLDRFEEAVIFLQKQPKVGGKGVGIIGRSKGGDIALSLAAFVPNIEAVVCINGCSANVAFPLYHKKQQVLSVIAFDHSKIITTASGARMAKHCMTNPLAHENKSSLVPVERAKGRFLLVASKGDLSWDSQGFMENMVERLRQHGKDNFESVSYTGAGHLLEPPYGPLGVSSFHGILGYPILWGGESKAHIVAEVHCWKMIQDFLRSQLSCDASQTKANL